LFGALGWSYVACIAVVHPEKLSAPFADWPGLRRDSLGTLCFVVSFTAHVVNGIRSGSAIGYVAARSVHVYSVLVTVYLLGNSIAHPATMAMPLTHFFRFPSEKLSLVVALIAAMCSFLVMRSAPSGRPAPWYGWAGDGPCESGPAC
jgi:hypothetical protein